MEILSRKASRLNGFMKEILADLTLGDEGLMRAELEKSLDVDDGTYIVVLRDREGPVSWGLVQPKDVWGGDRPRVMVFTEEESRCRGFGSKVMAEILEREERVVVSSWDQSGERFYRRFDPADDRRFDAGVLAPSYSTTQVKA